MTEPKPLDLNMEETIKRSVAFIIELMGFDQETKKIPEQTPEDTEELIKTIEAEMSWIVDKTKERIKSALEFYFKYALDSDDDYISCEEKVRDFWKLYENDEMRWIYKLIKEGRFEPTQNKMLWWNEELIRYAFKRVFDEEVD